MAKNPLLLHPPSAFRPPSFFVSPIRGRIGKITPDRTKGAKDDHKFSL